jgi:hypothetical protein
VPAPRFSVVIPTRERAGTLRFALAACLDQSFDDYEVVVSDNHSSPATKQVVDAAGSPRVRYVRTPRPVAMSNNWEFGLSHARGQFVLLIGDDDGLLPHALAELDRLAREHDARAIRWSAAYYTWPTVALPGQGDYLRLPMGRSLCERDSAEVIREVVAFREFYTALPMLYNAAVRRDVLAKLRQRTGRVLPHPVPDVYSGFAVAAAAGRFISTNVPMGVSGQSAASNGIATLFNRGNSDIDREFRALNVADGLRGEPGVPDVPAFPHVPVADSFACAKRLLFPEEPVEIDRKALARACVRGARVSEADWPATLRAVRASLDDVPELQRWFDAELAHVPYTSPAPMRLRPDRLGFDGTDLHLDAAAFGVRDVAGAARLCEQILNYRRDGVAYRFETVPSEPALWVLQEKEEVIQRLHASGQQLRVQSEALACRVNEQQAEIERLTATLEDRRGFRGLVRRAARRILPR